jgi:hypothetical protein
VSLRRIADSGATLDPHLLRLRSTAHGRHMVTLTARRRWNRPVTEIPVTAARDMSAIAQPIRRSTPVRGAQKAGRDKGQAEHPHARPAVNARLPTPLLGLAVVYLLSASIV